MLSSVDMKLRSLGGWGVAVVFVLLSSCSSGSRQLGDGSGDGAPPLGHDGETKGTADRLVVDAPAATSSAGAFAADGSSAAGSSSEIGSSSASTPVTAPRASSPAPASPVSSTSSGNAAALPESGVVNPPPRPAANVLTAGAWDDNRNLERFLAYRSELEQQQLSGLLDFSADDHEAAQPLGTPAPHTTLDVSLVIDTTGSMGDELAYLQSEFDAISSQIEANYPNAEQRWSLVVYRDEGDTYVTRWFDFRDDPADFRSHLAEQAAGGGGDFPEAADQGLATMNQLAWRQGDGTARLAFWLADAPYHTEKAAAMQTAILAAQARGVHVYPVASSGIDDFTELAMRSTAQLTGGRYLFLTNDSGVGDSHKEPSIPCYFVTKLDDAILRMVDIEMTGVYREPDPAQILRTGGDPQDGACSLASGQTVFVF
jgi:hypothetical protein